MALFSRTVTVSMGKPFLTGEECPHCLFDSVSAVLLWIDDKPSWMWLCGRCKKRLREDDAS